MKPFLTTVPIIEQEVLDAYDAQPKWYEQGYRGDTAWVDSTGWDAYRNFPAREVFSKIGKELTYEIFTRDITNEQMTSSLIKNIAVVLYGIITTPTCDFASTEIYCVNKKSGGLVRFMRARLNPLIERYDLALPRPNKKYIAKTLLDLFTGDNDIAIYRMGTLKNHVVLAPAGTRVLVKDGLVGGDKYLGNSSMYKISGSKYSTLVPMFVDTGVALKHTRKYDESDFDTLEPTDTFNINNCELPIDLLSMSGRSNRFTANAGKVTIAYVPIDLPYTNTSIVTKCHDTIKDEIFRLLNIDQTETFTRIVENITSAIVTNTGVPHSVFSYVDQNGDLRYLLAAIYSPFTNSVQLVDMLKDERDKFTEYLNFIDSGGVEVFQYHVLPAPRDHQFVISHHKDLLYHTVHPTEYGGRGFATYRFKELNIAFHNTHSATFSTVPFTVFRVTNENADLRIPDRLIKRFKTIIGGKRDTDM